MRLAKKCGLPVADCSILTLNDEPFYVVIRFDRETLDGITVRLHQEDLCQLLNVPRMLKYQEDGGPGIEDCMRRIAEIHLSAAPAAGPRFRGHKNSLSFVLGVSSEVLGGFLGNLCRESRKNRFCRFLSNRLSPASNEGKKMGWETGLEPATF